MWFIQLVSWLQDRLDTLGAAILAAALVAGILVLVWILGRVSPRLGVVLLWLVLAAAAFTLLDAFLAVNAAAERNERARYERAAQISSAVPTLGAGGFFILTPPVFVNRMVQHSLVGSANSK